MACERIVELGERSYPIHVGAGLLSSVGVFCRDQTRSHAALIVSDEQVDSLYGPAAEDALRAAGMGAARITVPVGEPSKSHEQLVRLYDAALDAGLDRSSCIMALGGGVVGDLAGYAAATYLRGIRLVQVPTSLLAMVDSAVGGKTGINLPQGKNLVGSFYQPELVVADTTTLRTLAPREFAAGLAEVIKYGVIADPSLLDVLENKTTDAVMQDDALLETLICRSCEIKADVVRQDEREGGLRAILNFGHTLGHAIEQVAGYGQYLHGEAIAMGMLFAVRLSERILSFPAEDTTRLMHVLEGFDLTVAMPDLAWPELMEAMYRDKKKQAGAIGFVLAERLGRVQYGCVVPESELSDVWHEIKGNRDGRLS